MKQVIKKACQLRIEGKIRTFSKDDVVEYEDEHPYLTPIAGETEEAMINFATAGEDELFEAEYDLESIKDYIIEVYNVPVRVKTKKKLIEKLLDCRFRDVNESDKNRLD